MLNRKSRTAESRVKPLEGVTVVVPLYLTEISPVGIRGLVGSFHQLLITISILSGQVRSISYYLGVFISQDLQLLGIPSIFGTADRWPYIFGFVAIPAFIQVYTLPMIPESPSFTLCIRGDVEQARADLELLRETKDVGLNSSTSYVYKFAIERKIERRSTQIHRGIALATIRVVPTI